MVSNRKEWRARKTICCRCETEVAFAARATLTDRHDCFGGSERGLGVNSSLRRRDRHAEVDVLRFLYQFGGPRWELRVVSIVGYDGPCTEQHILGRDNLVNL